MSYSIISKNECDYNDHLQVLLFSRYEFAVMPANVPILPEMQVSQLLYVNLHEFPLFPLVLYELTHHGHGHEVHEGARIDCVVDTVFEVGAWLASSEQTAVLDVVSHETPIVHDLRQPACEIDIGIETRGVSTEHLREEQTQGRTPTLAASIQQVIYRVQ